MDAEDFRYLWQLVEVYNIVAKPDEALAHYDEKIQANIEKLGLKQQSNSADLLTYQERIDEGQVTISGFDAQIKDHEKKIKNLKARKQATANTVEECEVKVEKLKEVAAELTGTVLDLKKLQQKLVRYKAIPIVNRFLGQFGDGDSANLRNLANLFSFDDVEKLSGVDCLALMTFAAANGVETNKEWKETWKDGDIQNWPKYAGKKPGSIPINNRLTVEQLVSLVPSPKKGGKRGRASFGLCGTKKRRLSKKEKKVAKFVEKVVEDYVAKKAQNQDRHDEDEDDDDDSSLSSSSE